MVAWDRAIAFLETLDTMYINVGCYVVPGTRTCTKNVGTFCTYASTWNDSYIYLLLR